MVKKTLRIALLNPTAHFPQTIGCCNLLHGSADSHQRLLDEGTRAILCSKRILNLTLSKAQIHTCPLVLTVPHDYNALIELPIRLARMRKRHSGMFLAHCQEELSQFLRRRRDGK
jgi:hypothetical protein